MFAGGRNCKVIFDFFLNELYLFSQLWCYNGKLFIPHGKALTVIPFTCETSSLAAVLGKLKQPSATGRLLLFREQGINSVNITHCTRFC